MLEKSNYKHNKAIDVSGRLINGQTNGKWGRMKFGVTTLAKNGSGIIAVYNLMVLLNHNVSLAEICRELYIKARFPFGVFGARPLKIFRYFSSHYIPVNLDRDYDGFCEKLVPGYCGIVIRWTGRRWFSPLQAAAIENDNGKIYVYNRIPDAIKRYEYNSARNVADKESFLVGYYINADEFSYN